MGITGLLPCLKESQRMIHIRSLPREGRRNLTVGIDGYCWLHRGTYSCALELTKGISTTRYVKFCMDRIEMLLHNDLTPFVVFDGAPLPAKKGQEEKKERIA